MNALFVWLEATGIARAIAGSTMLTGSLSAVHVVGFTLVMGGALVANVQSIGALFSPREAIDLDRSASRIILTGLAISLVTGVLLFTARATDVSSNGIFQLKMLLLIAAALFHFTVRRRVAVHAKPARAAGALSLALWLALAVTACAFILLE
jgi:hypothetical protein